jgi:hypothetical protein
VIEWAYVDHPGHNAVIYRDDIEIAHLNIIETSAIYEPHVDWLPAARKRDRITAIRLVLRDLAAQKPTIITARTAIAPYWGVWVKRGVLRQVGTIQNVPVLHQIHIFQVNQWAL